MDATQQKGSPTPLRRWRPPEPQWRKQLRSRTVGTKLTDREYAVAKTSGDRPPAVQRTQCEKWAARRGQTLSEWCRQALLDAVAGPAPRPEAEVILSEILVLQCSERRLPLDFRFSPAHRRPPKSHRS